MTWMGGGIGWFIWGRVRVLDIVGVGGGGGG